MKKYFFLILLVCCCSKSSDSDETHPYPDQYGGNDLFSQLSQDEKKILGKWYFAYRIDEYEDGTIETHYESNTTYHPVENNQKDSIIFFSNQFVGLNWTCPFETPPLLDGKLIKLVEPRAPGFFDYCFPIGLGGWLIENDSIIYYRGYDIDDILKYPIVKLNNDSLVFAYDFPVNPYNNIVKRIATFYKD